jgi:hypothetical protein
MQQVVDRSSSAVCLVSDGTPDVMPVPRSDSRSRFSRTIIEFELNKGNSSLVARVAIEAANAVDHG